MNMKTLKFYKLYDWIIDEMGLSADAGLIAVIHSFAEMRKECQMSYTDFADILKVSRRKAIDRIKRLANDGYLHIKTSENENGKQANSYTVNYAKFGNITTPSDGNVTTPSDGNVTTLVTETSPPTITENKIENKIERGRTNPPLHDGNKSEIALSLSDKDEYFIRYKVDYTKPKPNNTHKHSAEYYIDLIKSREYPLAKVLRFIQDDYYILTDAEADRRKTEQEHDEELLRSFELLANSNF